MTDSFLIPEGSEHLSQIKTMLSNYLQGGQAGHEQFLRYYGAAYRYFLALVHNADQAKELTNQFAQRFLAGELRKFDPAKGRFRDYLKTALRNMARDHFRRQKRQAHSLPEEEVPDEQAATFDTAWQEELLHQAWKSLEKRQHDTGKPFYTVLRFKSEHPKLRSSQLAFDLGELLGQSLTAVGVRQLVRRARQAFQGILLDEVSRTLGSADLERQAEELRELNLWDYCKDEWQNRKQMKNTNPR